jgi:hypothetical protein
MIVQATERARAVEGGVKGGGDCDMEAVGGNEAPIAIPSHGRVMSHIAQVSERSWCMTIKEGGEMGVRPALEKTRKRAREKLEIGQM